MRPFIIAAGVAVGLVALWAAILPLTAQPATKHTAASSPAMSKALFPCRGQNGLNQICVGALAKALVLDVRSDAPIEVAGGRCQAGQQVLASLGRRD